MSKSDLKPCNFYLEHCEKRFGEVHTRVDKTEGRINKIWVIAFLVAIGLIGSALWAGRKLGVIETDVKHVLKTMNHVKAK